MCKLEMVVVRGQERFAIGGKSASGILIVFGFSHKQKKKNSKNTEKNVFDGNWDGNWHNLMVRNIWQN